MQRLMQLDVLAIQNVCCSDAYDEQTSQLPEGMDGKSPQLYLESMFQGSTSRILWLRLRC